MSISESVQHCGEPPASAVRTVRNTRMPFPQTVQGCTVVSAAWRLNARHRIQDLPDGVDSVLLVQIILSIPHTSGLGAARAAMTSGRKTSKLSAWHRSST